MQFVDMDEVQFYFKEISLVTDQGIMSGKANGKFEPRTMVTVGEFMSIVWRILGCGHEPKLEWPLENSRESERGVWSEIYLANCRAQGIDYSADLAPDSVLTIGEPLNIMEKLSTALSAQFNINFSYDRRGFFHKYPWTTEHTKATRDQVACLVYWFCQNIGNQILEHDTHVWHETLFIVTETARFFLAFANTNSELRQIANLLYQRKCTSINLYESMKLILQSKKTILGSLQCNNPIRLFHYTKLSTLINLAPETFGFRLSNAAFLNDPSEGRLLTQRLQHEIGSQLPYSLSIPSLISPNFTYLASFNPTDDSLPMWVQYGDNAAGCAIGFDPNAFMLPVYRVSYNLNDFDSFFNQLKQELSKIDAPEKADFWTDPRITLYLYAESCLNELAYLYKDPHYSHEQELRIIKTRHPKMAKKEDHLREGELFLRTYVEVPYRILSVTFGTNLPDPQKLAVGFSSIGLFCNFKQSTIPFRN